MSENYEIDFAVGYTYDFLTELVTKGAARENLSIDEYIKKMEKDYNSDLDYIFDALVQSTDKEEIRILIGKMLDAKCEWSLIDRYDYERKNPDERG